MYEVREGGRGRREREGGEGGGRTYHIIIDKGASHDLLEG